MYKITVNGRIEFYDFGYENMIRSLELELASPRNDIRVYRFQDGQWHTLSIERLLMDVRR